MADYTAEGYRWRSRPDSWAELKHVARSNRKAPTAAERLLWRELRNSKLGVKFRRQHAIGPYIVDFYSAAGRLVVEVDGDIHNLQVAQDRARQQFIEAHGLKLIRFRNQEVLSGTQAVIDRIAVEIDYPPLRLRRGGLRG